MLHVQAIQSLEQPELLPYRTMRQQRDHHAQRIFVAEGEKVVRRLLESRLTVNSLMLPGKWLADLGALAEARPEPIQAYVLEKPELEKLTGFSMYQGVLAVGRVPEPVALDAVFARSPSPRLFAAVDGLNNSENLGALVRNAAAFGVQALLVGETCSSPYLRRAVRSSMGTIFSLPVHESADLAATLRELAARGVHCVAAHPHTDRRTVAAAELRGDCCVVFGSEGTGVSAAVRDACHECVAIPMQAGVDSLNVGSAAAVFLYEANRQRGLM